MIDKALILLNEMININNLINNMDFNEDYQIEDSQDFITLEYLDAYNYEKITLEPILFNDYGVMKYIISVESYDLDNELQLQDYFYHNEIRITENKLNQIERKTEKERNKYLEAKPIILNAWPEKLITVENTISNRECFLNVTHYHYYYSKIVTLEARDFNDIEPFLKLRDFFNNIKFKGDR